MRVYKNDQIITFGWKYESPILLRKLQKAGLNEARAREIVNTKIEDPKNPGKQIRAGIPALCKLLGIKQLPRPTRTWCIIKDEDKNVIASAFVKKWVEDPFDIEKARTHSLTKVLHKLYPGQLDEGGENLDFDELGKNRNMRKAFWEAYWERKKKDPAPVFAD